MANFIQLKSSKPDALRQYKREVRAIVIDRAADHVQQAIARYKRPTGRTYEKALQDGLTRAKLDVMAELFRIMHDLARQNVVSQWSRGDSGLRRERRSSSAIMELIGAYDQVVRYVANMKAQRKQS
ncbi:MAG: hypothetical protein R3E86_14265 [Pseudomonadales bacterium]